MFLLAVWVSRFLLPYGQIWFYGIFVLSDMEKMAVPYY
jgi:hypothetical protein